MTDTTSHVYETGSYGNVISCGAKDQESEVVGTGSTLNSLEPNKGLLWVTRISEEFADELVVATYDKSKAQRDVIRQNILRLLGK